MGNNQLSPSGRGHNTAPARAGVTQISNKSLDKTSKSVKGNKRAKSQRRQDRWLSRQSSVEQRKKYRAFLKGYSSFHEKCSPTDTDIELAMGLGKNSSGGIYLNEEDYRGHCNASSGNVEDTDGREMTQLLQLLQDGGVGYMPRKKGGGWVRLMFENWNSLGVGTHGWKVDRLNQMIKDLNVDVIAGCESQCHWNLVPAQKQFMQLICPGMSTRGIAANNRNETINRDQMGGTAIAAIGRLSDVVTEVGCDITGLGRWSWIRVGTEFRHTRLLCGYLPCKPGKTARGHTVWEQHSRYFQAKGDFRSPSEIFIDDLANQVSIWRTSGDEVIVCVDANQDVYNGALAVRLARPDTDLRCIMEPALGERVPNSHSRGSGKISTIFGSPGLEGGHAMCYPHWYGVGDHRVFMIEISAASLFGGEYPTIARPKSRSLTCKITRIRRKYSTTLSDLVTRHNMESKLDCIQELSNTVSAESVHQMHNKWDREMGDFMRHSEKVCTKFKSCAIEFSPTVGQWLRRRAVLKWLLRWHAGKVPDTRNLCRAARRANIVDPLSLSENEVKLRLQKCLEHLFDLQAEAPALRRKHLQWRLNVAKQQDDEEASTEVLRIIRREASRQRQRNINRVVRRASGRSVLSVGVTSGSGIEIYTDRRAVEDVCGERLGERFSLGKRAPLSASTLREEIGELGDTDAARLILANEYDYPENWDTATVDLLKACARVCLECEKYAPLESAVTPSDFVQFWATSKEATSSSKSGRHFGHYRAITDDESLVSLHVRSINLAASRGNPLDRWREGVTVLLEKVAGNNRIDKLRAICLLEADFNWWLKVHFAKKMTHQMKSSGVLPIEQGATSGKTALDSSMTKQLFFDQANILHQTAAVSSTDAANCYDAVNHTAVSLALQAMTVPLNIIKCYLLCIQTMRFFLKTGFGLATHSYGGTKDNPYMGLTQGSGASPAAWTAISTVMLNAYKFNGHGACFLSAWSGLCICLAALLYVDDTDLLHMNVGNTSEKAFCEKVQKSTSYWAYLLQATGGNLKPEKCYWYLMSYKFVKGVATLRPLREIRQHQLRIPQPGAADVVIELKDPAVASEVLGVWSSPSSVDTAQLDYMLGKGKMWGRRVLHSTLLPSDVWHSFRIQALPSVKYGLLVLMTSPRQLDEAFSAWYFSILPALGVNRNIAREWRTLPVCYQGLGLPQMSLEKLALSLQYLYRHWDQPTAMGKILRASYELVQIEVGLFGNFLCRDYTTFGCLASHTWFKLVWEYTHLYGVQVELRNVEVPKVRQRDRVLMEEVIQVIPPSQWPSFNRARKHFKVYFLSQLTLCDGVTVNPATLGNGTWKLAESSMTFPVERPTPSDIALWRETIAVITSKSYRLSPRLGKHIRLPYDAVCWMTTGDNNTVVRIDGQGNRTRYVPVPMRYSTRGRQRYRKTPDVDPSIECNYVASVQEWSDSLITLHSQSLLDCPTTVPTSRSLHQILGRMSPCSFQNGLSLKGDGEWIFKAFERGSLLACHDGSFMPDKDGRRCSAAVVLLCQATGSIATVTYCETTSLDVASNYRGELIGGVAISIILLALSRCTRSSSTKAFEVYCDNMGVVQHGNARHKPLPEKQPQADLIYQLRHNLDRLPIDVTYIHVYGHLDDQQQFQQLSLPQQLNVMADKIAKECLLANIAQDTKHGPSYPEEHIRIWIGGEKITSSIKDHLYKSWGHKVVKTLLLRRRKVDTAGFSHIAWDVVGRAMLKYPQMFTLWVTKHVSGFSGTNRQLSRIDSSHTNQCPCCGQSDESTLHITRCTNPGRQRVFQQSVDVMLDWMEQSHCDLNVVECLEEYLSHRGKRDMRKICRSLPYLAKWATEMDTLGWENFMEGRIGLTLLEMQQETLKNAGSRQHIKSWAVEYIQHILGITHKQWVYRNTRTHICLLDGKTEADHERIMEQVSDLLFTDPDELLPEHRHLLELDFSELGAGSTTARQYWMANITSAIEAGRRCRHRLH